MTDQHSRTTSFERVPGVATPATRAGRTTRTSVTVGERLGDRYLILEELGSGGFGSVFRAKDLQLDREVALKLLHRFAESVSPEVVDAVIREGRALARLQHPNIVPVFDAGRLDGVPFLTMGLVRGRPLGEVVRAEGTLSLERMARLNEQLCSALDHAHDASLVHRDVKPINVLVDEDDGLQLVDFGIALRARADAEEPSVIGGTLGYIAPEVLEGESPSARSDQFAAAVTCYEMLAGRKAYSSNTPANYMSELKSGTQRPLERLPSRVPRSVRQVLERALSADPAARYPSCGAFAHALRRVVEAPRRRRRRLAIAALVAVAVAGAALAWPSRPLEVSSQLRGLVETRAGVRVETSVDDRAALTAGDWFWLDDVRVTRDAHAAVVLLDADGELTVLCPGPTCRPGVLTPGRPHRLPPEGQPSWQLDESTGFESLFLIASHERLTDAQLNDAVAEARTRLAADAPRTRGVRATPLPDTLERRVIHEEQLVDVLARRFDDVRSHRILHE